MSIGPNNVADFFGGNANVGTEPSATPAPADQAASTPAAPEPSTQTPNEPAGQPAVQPAAPAAALEVAAVPAADASPAPDRYAELEARYNALAERFNQFQQPQAQSQQPQQPQFDVQPLTLTDEDFALASESAQGLSTVMSKVFNHAVQETMRNVPQLVNMQAMAVYQNLKLADQFMSQNPDLVQFRQAFGMFVEQLAATEPALRGQELLVKAADEFRKQLKLPKPQRLVDNSPPAAQAPVAPNRAAAPTNDHASSIARELFAMRNL